MRRQCTLLLCVFTKTWKLVKVLFLHLSYFFKIPLGKCLPRQILLQLFLLFLYNYCFKLSLKIITDNKTEYTYYKESKTNWKFKHLPGYCETPTLHIYLGIMNPVCEPPPYTFTWLLWNPWCEPLILYIYLGVVKPSPYTFTSVVQASHPTHLPGCCETLTLPITWVLQAHHPTHLPGYYKPLTLHIYLGITSPSPYTFTWVLQAHHPTHLPGCCETLTLHIYLGITSPSPYTFTWVLQANHPTPLPWCCISLIFHIYQAIAKTLFWIP